MRRTKDAAAVTKETLLHAALHVFSTKGYAATTLDDIATNAGTTRGAIYWHFGGKAELYNALINDLFSNVLVAFQEVFNQVGTPLEKLRHLMIFSLTQVEDDPNYRAVQELNMFKTELTPDLIQAKGFEEKNKTNRALITFVTELLKEGIASGEIRQDIEPETVAIAGIGLIAGVTALWLQDTSAFSLKNRTEGIVESFLHGIVSKT